MSFVHSKYFRCSTSCKQSSTLLESYNPVYQSNSTKGEHNPEIKQQGKERWRNSASNFCLGDPCDYQPAAFLTSEDTLAMHFEGEVVQLN